LNLVLTDYGSIIEGITDTLLDRLEDNEGKAVLLNELCRYYIYDAMSSLTFGYSTQFLEGRSTKAATEALDNITKGITEIGILLHVPWLLTILETIPFAGPLKNYNLWCDEQIEKRRITPNPSPDFFRPFLKNPKNYPSYRARLHSDARVIMK